MGPLNCLSTIRLLKLILLTALLFSWCPVASRCIGKARHHFEAAPVLVRWIVSAVAKRRLSIRFYQTTIVITQKTKDDSIPTDLPVAQCVVSLDQDSATVVVNLKQNGILGSPN